MSTKSFINFVNKYDRVVVLIDMDCFYCQVEEKLDPSLKGKPIAVVQYNEWKGGGIIAVNYPAREKGVTRHMRGEEAKQLSANIELCRVPNVRGKADLTKYRDAGKDVAEVLQGFTPLLERASVDEAYLDITESVNARLRDMNEGKFQLDASKFESTFAVGYEKMGDFVHDITTNCQSGDAEDYSKSFEDETEHEISARQRSDLKLLIGASIVAEIRQAVKLQTTYECSAGIAHNKILAKLTAGMNKPNKQTVLPLRSIPKMYSTLPLTKVKGLGGKLGERICELFKIKTMAELASVSREMLVQKFDDKNGNWLFWLSKGIDLESVMPRFTNKSIGCCKKFPGVSAITGFATLQHWLGELATEICERLAKDMLENHRVARQMVVSYTQAIGNDDVSSSRTVALNHFTSEPIVNDALDVIRRNTAQFFKPENQGCLNNPIKFLGLSVGKFEDRPDTSKRNAIQELFEKKHKQSVDEGGIPKVESKTGSPVKINSLKTMIEKMREKSKDDSERVVSEHFQLEKSLAIESIAEPKHKEEEIVESMENEVQDKNVTDTVAVDVIEEPVEDEKSSELDDKSFDEEQLLAKICNEPLEDVPAEKEEDYKTTYAEFAHVEVRYITCSLCKQQIPQHEVQEHADFHVALKVSQQQRVDFRSQLKAKAKSQPVSKKEKSQQKSQKDKCRTLDFFLRKDDTKPVDIEAIKCKECLKDILITEISEHHDYHVAKKIQIELNRSEMASTSNKKRRLSDANDLKAVKVKPLTEFFTKR